MGYDYIPHNPAIEPQHLNITGHAYLRQILEQIDIHALGSRARVDKLWAVTNDGDIVPADVAKDWGTRLRELLEHDALFEVAVPDRLYVGQERQVPEADVTLRGVHSSTAREIKPEWKAMLLEMADFMVKSEGFEQW